MITLRNKFDALQEIAETLTLNDKYKNFVNAYIEAAAAECIPTKLRAKYSSLWDISSQEKVTDEPITKIIDNQLDIKLGQFTQKLFNVGLTKIKNRKAAGLDEILPEV